MEYIWLRVEFVRVHRREVHDVANIEIVDPVIVIFDTECVTHINFESFVGLELYNFILGCETWLPLMRGQVLELNYVTTKFAGNSVELIE